MICGADSWVGVAAYGRAKEAWLRTWLKLDNGVPSHDTFGRVFAMLDAEQFRKCLTSWMRAVQEATGGQVCIDGKCVRGSRDGVVGKSAIHMVSAWAAGNHLVLRQVKVDEKSNEIRAIPSLLEALDLAGRIVSIDAAGCQRKVAEQIVAEKADYVLAVKGNQGQLHDDLSDFFEVAQSSGYKDVAHSYARTMDEEHGRIEVRECWATSDARCLACIGRLERWAGLRSVAVLRRRRRKSSQGASCRTAETAYYISSLEADADKVLEATRTHWGIENSPHWILDVAFNEDDCRERNGNAAENLVTVRGFALGLLKHDTQAKAGIKTKRQVADRNAEYLLHLICL